MGLGSGCAAKNGRPIMFRVKCPMCGGVLTVDPRTRKVVAHQTAEESQQTSDERFDAIVKGLERSKAEQQSRLEAAKTREAKREKQLDQLFEDARAKARENPDEGKPMGPIWD